MATYTIDTAEAIKRLQDAQCDLPLAEAIVSIMRESQEQHATKSDLELLKMEMNGRFDTLESNLSGQVETLEAKLDGRMDALETKLDGRMDGFDTKLESLETRMDGFDTKLESLETNIEVRRSAGENRMKVWFVAAFLLALAFLRGIEYLANLLF